MSASPPAVDGHVPASGHDDVELRGFDASLPMALLAARESSMRHFRPLLARHGITEQQWRVLRALSAASTPIDASALAGATRLLAPSLSRILANLAERALIERTSDPDDQRRTLLALSTGGARLVATVAPGSEAVYSMIEDRFGADRLARLVAELHELAELLDPEES